jgi:hypothetical protein
VSAKQSRAVAGRERTGTIVTTLVEPDYRALQRELLGPVPSSAVASAPLRLKAGFLSKVAPVIGVEPDYFRMKSWLLDNGAFFDDEDIRRSARVALLGHTVAADLFEASDPVGERLFINRVPFEVIGVLSERGPGLDAVNEDGRVYVPLTAAMRRLLNIDYYNSILFEITELGDMSRAERDITALLRVRHRISSFRPDDFQVLSQRELIETQLRAAWIPRRVDRFQCAGGLGSWDPGDRLDRRPRSNHGNWYAAGIRCNGRGCVFSICIRGRCIGYNRRVARAVSGLVGELVHGARGWFGVRVRSNDGCPGARDGILPEPVFRQLARDPGGETRSDSGAAA